MIKSTELILNFVVIRNIATRDIWDCALLPNDQDNEVFLSPPSWANESSAEYSDFEKHFLGTNNARYFTDTKYFEVENVSKTVTFQ